MTPGLRIPAGSSAALAAVKACPNSLRSLAAIPRVVVAAHGVVVGDRPAVSQQRVGRGGLDLVPHRQLRADAAGRRHREVRRRTVGIDVREAARHPASAADPLDRLLDRRSDAGMKRVEGVPRAGRLERLRDHAAASERVALVRRPQERRAPRADSVVAGSRGTAVGSIRRGDATRHVTTVVATQLHGASHRLFDGMVGGLEAEHEEASRAGHAGRGGRFHAVE